MSTVIATHRLTKRYGGRAVVNGLNLGVPQGAIYALLGDNGAGKSTTIRMLTGLLPPDSGRAEILGEDCWSAAVRLRHRVGYVPEKPRFYDWMSVGDIGWFTAGFHRPGFRERYLEAVARFGLDPRAKLKTLSKGGYAKVGLSLALAPDPDVLILDEPTSGLDLFTRREFLASMVDLAGAGRTILLCSHGVAEVERIASHAAFLAGGRLLLSGTLEDLRRRVVRVRLRYAGSPPDPAGLGAVLEHTVSGPVWQAVVQDLDAGAADALRGFDGVSGVEEQPLTLEEMYAALLGRYHHGAHPARAGGNGQVSDRVTAAEAWEERP